MKKLLLILFIATTTCLGAQSTDALGKKQGYWKKRDPKTDKLVYEGEFKDDVPVGKFKYYYPNDSVRAIMYFKDAGKTAYARLFHMSGKRMAEGRYYNKEIKDSVWTYYDEAGSLLSREKYVMGKKQGAAFVYFPDGVVSEERNYKNDIQDGIFKQYFDAKRLRASGAYVNGQLDGKVCYFYPNGVEAAAGYYINGQKNGAWIYKSQNGKIKDKELYVNGKQAGKKETEAFFLKNKSEEIKTTPQNTANPKNNPTKNKTK